MSTTTSTTPTTCACGTPLTGRTDTFGRPGEPEVCAVCWYERLSRQRKAPAEDKQSTLSDALTGMAMDALLRDEPITVREVRG